MQTPDQGPSNDGNALAPLAQPHGQQHLSALTRLVTPEQVMGFAQSEHSDLRALAEENGGVFVRR